MKTFPVFASLWLAASVLSAATTPPKPLTTVDPGYPAELADTGLGGKAVLSLLVKADGTVGDATVQSTDHLAFGMAALAAVKGWKFEPAQKDGVPVDIRVSLPFVFNAPITQILNAGLHRRVYQNLPETPLTEKEFGPAPKLRRAATLGYPPTLIGSGTEETVLVRFVVGPDGNTFNPVVQGSPRKEFVVPALTAIAHSAYEPPRKDGRAVYVEASESLHFFDPTAPRPGDSGK